ncbi:hypothetical protein [Metamycoplasma hominis]|uniref:hypothetical protein n=1 Tax=Metamycoplasma hominis TaxID=2098 RepID=UPI001F44C5C1|nr:hypothetical protein [Metamycoplasma hominis]
MQSKVSKGELKSFDYKDYEFEGLTKDSKDNYQYTKTITLDKSNIHWDLAKRFNIIWWKLLTIPMNLTVDGLGKETSMNSMPN